MIRIAAKEDLARVNVIREQVHEAHCTGRPDIFRREFSEELQNVIYSVWENEDSDVIVAVRDGEICGFACVNYIVKPLSPYNLERKYYNIVEFGVDKQFRRQKVATELFDFIKKDAKAKGYDKIELDMWEFNQGALRFYESVGFSTYRRYMEYHNT